ncbi:MAG: hypothetical protein Q4G68_13525 [Planctomycetia bacterium]|nr:hypothetical protein [Planctomycetia bacterium]
MCLLTLPGLYSEDTPFDRKTFLKASSLLGVSLGIPFLSANTYGQTKAALPAVVASTGFISMGISARRVETDFIV